MPHICCAGCGYDLCCARRKGRRPTCVNITTHNTRNIHLAFGAEPESLVGKICSSCYLDVRKYNQTQSHYQVRTEGPARFTGKRPKPLIAVPSSSTTTTSSQIQPSNNVIGHVIGPQPIHAIVLVTNNGSSSSALPALVYHAGATQQIISSNTSTVTRHRGGPCSNTVHTFDQFAASLRASTYVYVDLRVIWDLLTRHTRYEKQCVTPYCLGTMQICGVRMDGLALCWQWHCFRCSYQEFGSTCPLRATIPRISPNTPEINVALVNACLQSGVTHTRLNNFFHGLGVQNLPESSFYRLQQLLMSRTIEMGKKSCTAMLLTVVQYIISLKEEFIECSFDCSWGTRGFKSTHGSGRILASKRHTPPSSKAGSVPVIWNDVLSKPRSRADVYLPPLRRQLQLLPPPSTPPMPITTHTTDTTGTTNTTDITTIANTTKTTNTSISSDTSDPPDSSDSDSSDSDELDEPSPTQSVSPIIHDQNKTIILQKTDYSPTCIDPLPTDDPNQLAFCRPRILLNQGTHEGSSSSMEVKLLKQGLQDIQSDLTNNGHSQFKLDMCVDGNAGVLNVLTTHSFIRRVYRDRAHVAKCIYSHVMKSLGSDHTIAIRKEIIASIQKWFRMVIKLAVKESWSEYEARQKFLYYVTHKRNIHAMCLGHSRCRSPSYQPGNLTQYMCQQDEIFIFNMLDALEKVWPDNPDFCLVTQLNTSHTESTNQAMSRFHPKDTDFPASYPARDFIGVMMSQLSKEELVAELFGHGLPPSHANMLQKDDEQKKKAKQRYSLRKRKTVSPTPTKKPAAKRKKPRSPNSSPMVRKRTLRDHISSLIKSPEGTAASQITQESLPSAGKRKSKSAPSTPKNKRRRADNGIEKTSDAPVTRIYNCRKCNVPKRNHKCPIA